jgi:serine/threonine protein kinase
LIEGDTSSDRLKSGPIPVEEALKLALQIAEALEAAHEKGVIHRDLKPANIKATPDGKVKVLDFGLAKAYAGEMEEMNLSNSPTLSDAATQQGVILGTAAYMSPEQARGKQVDKRADVWAFGCVLFEMLTGKAAFSGRDVTDILAAVIRADPAWKSLPQNLHWRLREVLERCLEKEAKDRYSGISDARVDIQKFLTDPSGVFAQPVAVVEPQKKLRTILPWALLQQDYIEAMPQISPDGRLIADISNETGQDEIYVRPFPDVNKGRWQVSTDGGNSPLWSPDGRELFYLTGRATTEAVMRVAVQTESSFKRGTPEVLFRGTYVGFGPGTTANYPSWDIHPDGKRFLMIKETEITDDESTSVGPRKINIVLNWLEELKERVPLN